MGCALEIGHALLAYRVIISWFVWLKEPGVNFTDWQIKVLDYNWLKASQMERKKNTKLLIVMGVAVLSVITGFIVNIRSNVLYY